MARAAARIDPQNRRQRPAHPDSAELQGHQRQQHALAGAGRAHHQGMTDIADMKEKRNGVAPSVRAKKSGGPSRCSSVRSAHTAEKHYMGEVEGRDRRWRTLA